jgi:hypothetical protein
MVNATGLQKNTLVAVQSGKHGGDFARCNKQACKHGVASSECTWNVGQCGHIGQWNSCQVSQCLNWKVILSHGHKGLANCCAPCGKARNNMCELAWGEGGGVCDQGLCTLVQPHSLRALVEIWDFATNEFATSCNYLTFTTTVGYIYNYCLYLKSLATTYD